MSVDSDVIARIDRAKPGPSETEEPSEPEEPAGLQGSAWVFPKATLLACPGAAGSASGGAKAKMKFEVATSVLGALLVEGGFVSQSYDLSFDKLGLGIGTIGPWGGRPDEDGSPRSYVWLIMPQNQLPKLAQVYTRQLLGKTGKLTLEPMQQTLDLTTKAE